MLLTFGPLACVASEESKDRSKPGATPAKREHGAASSVQREGRMQPPGASQRSRACRTEGSMVCGGEGVELRGGGVKGGGWS